jgi:hypothetical protein
VSASLADAAAVLEELKLLHDQLGLQVGPSWHVLLWACRVHTALMPVFTHTALNTSVAPRHKPHPDCVLPLLPPLAATPCIWAAAAAGTMLLTSSH